MVVILAYNWNYRYPSWKSARSLEAVDEDELTLYGEVESALLEWQQIGLAR
jgi:hypothetical protein